MKRVWAYRCFARPGSAELSSHRGVGSVCEKSRGLLMPQGALPTPLPPTRHIRDVLKGGSSIYLFLQGQVVHESMEGSMEVHGRITESV